MNCWTKWVLADSNPNDCHQFGTKGCQTPTEVSPSLMATTWFPSQDREISVGSGLTLKYWSDYTSAMYTTTCHIVQRYKKVTKFSPKNKKDLQMACYAPPLEKAKKQPYPSSVPPHLNKCMLVKNFAWERKMTKSDFSAICFLTPTYSRVCLWVHLWTARQYHSIGMLSLVWGV